MLTKISGLEINYTQSIINNHKNKTLLFLNTFSCPVNFITDLSLTGEETFREMSLRSGYDVLSINAPGMGNSDIKESYKVKDMENDLIDIISEFKIDPSTLVFIANSGMAKICFLFSLTPTFLSSEYIFTVPGFWPTGSKSLMIKEYGLYPNHPFFKLNLSLPLLVSRFSKEELNSLELLSEKLKTEFFNTPDGTVDILLDVYNDSYQIISSNQFDESKKYLSKKKKILIGDREITLYREASTEFAVNCNGELIIYPFDISHFWMLEKNKNIVYETILDNISEN